MSAQAADRQQVQLVWMRTVIRFSFGTSRGHTEPRPDGVRAFVLLYVTIHGASMCGIDKNSKKYGANVVTVPN